MFRKKVAGLVTIMVVAAFTAQAKPTHHHFFYFSWGYNGEWYTHSTVHVKQDALGNDYQLNDVRAHDHKGWDDHFFQQQLTIPQYNYRIGFMVNEEKGMGIEINFDHTKFIIADPQQAHLTGTFNHRATDTTFTYSQENGFYYYLNNGANFFLVNFVKRALLYKSKTERVRIDALGKIGVGPVVPHADNEFFGHENSATFKVAGWNTGLEADVKATFFKYAYLEYGAKLDYAQYAGLHVYEGTAHQAFGTCEMILSLGINIPGKRWK